MRSTSIGLLLLVLSEFTFCQKPPNIVFILTDDMGFNDVGFNGRNHHSGVKTPYIDKLARDGVKLHNYYVQPICTPTRAQILTGVNPIHYGLQNIVIWPIQRKGLPLRLSLLPENLRACGYQTHMVGKWHLGFYREEYLPNNRGFDSYFGMLASHQDYFSHRRCWKGHCGIDMYSSKTGGPVNTTFGEYSTHVYTRKSIEAIANRDPEKPFFLYLSHQAVHIPVSVPRSYERRFSSIKNAKRRRYAGMVYALDESVRNITEYLRAQDLLDNTIIIFSTDNGGINRGGGNNWPLRGEKRTLWEGGIRSLGFMYGKPLGVTRTNYKGLLDASDWFPTLLSAASCPVMNGTQHLDGVDQWDAIRGMAPRPRNVILHTIGRDRGSKNNRFLLEGFDIRVKAAIRVGRWKLITGNPGPDHWAMPPEYEGEKSKFIPGTRGKTLLQLFDIGRDRRENFNVASEHPTIVSRLLRALARHSTTRVAHSRSRYDKLGDPKLNGGYWQPWVK